MNKDTFKGRWKQLKGKIKKHWARLTDNDLDEIHGSMDKFMGMLQEKYGWAKDRAKKEWDEFEHSMEEEHKHERKHHHKHRKAG